MFEPSGAFSAHDNTMLVAEVRRIGAKTALEFGPGASTLALVDAGLEKIVTLEHDPDWLATQADKFKDLSQVRVARYVDDPIVTADENGEFDIAFVDSPQGFHYRIPGRVSRKRHPGQEDCSRLNTCLFALDHAPVVILHDATRPLERGTLGRLNALGHKVTMLPSGMARIERNGKNTNGFSPPGAL
jgi:hypothetical protein